MCMCFLVNNTITYFHSAFISYVVSTIKNNNSIIILVIIFTKEQLCLLVRSFIYNVSTSTGWTPWWPPHHFSGLVNLLSVGASPS